MSAITSDPYFPQIPLILDPQRMCLLLQQFLFRSADLKKPKLIVVKCIIGEKRHKPGKSFVLSYHLDVRNIETGACFEQVLTAKLYQPGQHLGEFKQQEIKQLPSLFGIPALSHLPELCMMIWAFPNDSKLQHLHHFLNIEYLKTYLLGRSQAFGFNASDQITSVQLEILHYLPERSCMIRYQIGLTNAVTGAASQNLIIYGKHYRDGSGINVYSAMHQIARQISKSAQPLHYDPENKILWQSHVQGQAFSWEKQDTVYNSTQINKIAECVARFHLCSLNTPGSYDLTNIEQQLFETQQRASELNSNLSSRVRLLVNNLLNQRSELDGSSARTTPLHMDLKTQNFLLDRDSATLIDLDCVAIGDHLIDVGSLLANFYLNGLRAEYSVAEIDSIVKSFIHHYLALIPWPVDQSRLHWYTAAAFVHEVLRRSIRQCDEQRLQHIETYLELSERFLTLSKAG